MKRTVIGVACGLILLNTLGCVIAVNDEKVDADYIAKHPSWSKTQEQNRKTIAALDLGLTYEQALTLLGTPDFSEQFQQAGENYQVLYYRTHGHSHELHKNDCTPLVFKQKQLTGWGHDALLTVQGTAH